MKNSWESAEYAVEDIDDREFTTSLLAALEADFCVDTSRIYATGKSNGGGFVNFLACSPHHGGAFAAFAIASGAFYEQFVEGRKCRPARSPLPILEFHGSADPTIPYEGKKERRGRLPPIPRWLEQWAAPDRNDCPGPAEVSVIGDGKVQITSYCGATEGYLIDDMEHCWPSTEYTEESKTCGNRTTGPNTLAPIEATSIMMDFFNLYTKPDNPTSHAGLNRAQAETHHELL